jgi:hypothetical protein
MSWSRGATTSGIVLVSSRSIVSTCSAVHCVACGVCVCANAPLA